MSRLVPRSASLLARAVSDSLVVATDEGGRDASLFYWHHSRAWVGAVVEAACTAGDRQIRADAEALLAQPRSAACYRALVATLERVAGAHPSITDPLFAAAWDAECHSRLGYRLGLEYSSGVPLIRFGDLAIVEPGPPLPSNAEPTVLVVVPFRERGSEGWRARNLIACLLALRDQSYPREDYRVIVVESDSEPRWRRVVAPFCDQYFFAPKSGAFNKSWTVNVGAVQARGNADLLCVLDADVLCDRDFLSRNVTRFLKPGAGGHLPYRDMWCLDPSASACAIRDRIIHRDLAASPERLRGFLLRRPPGACVWVRAEVFHRIHGMDERYEGWGGEDNDFAFRISLDAPFDSYDDALLHLHHPPSSALVEGKVTNSDIPPLSWRPAEPIGQLHRSW